MELVRHAELKMVEELEIIAAQDNLDNHSSAASSKISDGVSKAIADSTSSSRAIINAREIEKAALHLLELMTSTRPRIRRLFESSALEPTMSIPSVLRRVSARY